MGTLFLCGTLLERLAQTNVIVGLALAALGFALTLLARRIAIFVRKEDKINDSDKVFMVVKAFGLVLILVALVILIMDVL